MPRFEKLDAVTLPLVELRTPLEKALDRMRDRQRSGIVATSGRQFLLFRVPEVLAGLASKQETLADLKIPGGGLSPRRLYRPTPLMVDLLLKGQAVRGLEPKIALRQWLDHRQQKYALVRLVQSRASVMTYSETLRLELEPEPSGCYCLVGHEHVPNGTHGGNCGTRRHGENTVYCL
jgi:hypothetical protein